MSNCATSCQRISASVGCGYKGLLRCVVFSLICTGASSGSALGFELVTESLAEQDREAQLESTAPALGAYRRMRKAGLTGPQVDVLAPSLSGPLKAPVDIILRWRTDDGASIDPQSLRVLYGMLKLDITARLQSNAKLSSQGLEAKGAQLPVGVHRVFVQISDSAKRTAQRELVIEIVDP